jgi:hypothetical protein
MRTKKFSLSLGVQMEPTQIAKSQTFALHFVTMITIYKALKDAQNGTLGSQETKDMLIASILEAVAAHPQPAEA